MTVCICAAIPHLNAIVAVSDTMLSDDVSSVDGAAFKVVPLFHGTQWYFMYAGIPTEAEALLQLINRHVAGSHSPEAVIRGVEQAYRDVLKRRIEQTVLASFGLTRDDFMAKGLGMFGEVYFRELSEECRRVRAATQLLVFGFDGAGTPHIFEATETGECTIHDYLRFHAIGTGAWAALGSLFANSVDVRTAGDISWVIYRLCEAKFVSEVARSVGSELTMVNVFYSDGLEYNHVVTANDDPIREAWDEHRSQPIPENVLGMIRQRDEARRREFDQQRTANPEPSKPSL